MFAERIPKTCSLQGVFDVGGAVADAVDVEGGAWFCVGEGVGEEVGCVEVSHENAAVGAGEVCAAVAAVDGDGVCNAVCFCVFPKVCAGVGVDFHGVDVCSGEGCGEGEVADPCEHVGDSFARGDEAAYPLFFEPVSLREHDFGGVEGVGDAGFPEGDVVGGAVEDGDVRQPHDAGVVVEEEDAGGVFPVDEGLEFVCVRGSAVQEEGVAEPLVAGAGVGAAFGEVEVVGEAVTDREVGPVVAAVGAAGLVNPGFSSALC